MVERVERSAPPAARMTWEHLHGFGTDARGRGERRTLWVIGLTAITMVGEIAGGLAFKSMALLADGWHMATHAAALGITLFAYSFARRHRRNPRFSFGTGKVAALGGFASGVALGAMAGMVLVESVTRLVTPSTIRFDQAITVAVLGLIVNLVSALLLHQPEASTDHDHHHHQHVDHNLRSAYLHVAADALTSLLAIGALLAGKLLGWGFMDPVMGVFGALLITRWSIGLLRQAGGVLLDAELDEPRRAAIRAAVEAEGENEVTDLHLWRIGPRELALILSVVTPMPRPPSHYKRLLRVFPDIAHVTVEVHGHRPR